MTLSAYPTAREPEVAESTDPHQSPARARRVSTGGSCISVLVVEDEDKIRELVRLVLAQQGFQVETAASAVLALQQATP